jgi:hypothetical protein
VTAGWPDERADVTESPLANSVVVPAARASVRCETTRSVLSADRGDLEEW